MKVRWREHGLILITLMTIAAIAGYAWDSYGTTPEQMNAYASPFVKDGFSFNYYKNILLPRIFFVMLLYACYLWFNLLIVPFAGKIVMEKKTGPSVIRIIWILFQLLLLSYAMALGANVATYYAHPYYYNYAGFSLLAVFGYNDQPLSNLFAGFERAVLIVPVYTVYVFLREVIINYLERPGSKKGYRILITNQVTISAVIFLFIPILLRSLNIIAEDHYFFDTYFFFLPPIFLIFLINTYWLFPLKGAQLFKSVKNVLALLFFTFICTLPFVVLLAHRSFGFFILFWAAQVCLITPLSWLIYQQWKDEILQLRGVEKQLLRSTADLQFLRTQINPHFLFNSLNTLYSTALQEESGKTAEGIQKLGDMMRFMLHENNLDYIPVSRELEYLENYISLQKLRIQSLPGIDIEEMISAQNCSHQIAPMLLIPLVENAFKHGISLNGRSWIKIRLDCDPKNINFEVRNSIHPLAKGDPEYERSGIGLNNIKERLALLYKGKHKFVYGQENNEFVVHLNIRA